MFQPTIDLDSLRAIVPVEQKYRCLFCRFCVNFTGRINSPFLPSWNIGETWHTIKPGTPEHGTTKHGTPAERRNNAGTTEHPRNDGTTPEQRNTAGTRNNAEQRIEHWRNNETLKQR